MVKRLSLISMEITLNSPHLRAMTGINCHPKISSSDSSYVDELSIKTNSFCSIGFYS